MKIDVKTLEKLVWIIYKRFFIEKGKLKDIQIKKIVSVPSDKEFFTINSLK